MPDEGRSERIRAQSRVSEPEDRAPNAMVRGGAQQQGAGPTQDQKRGTAIMSVSCWNMKTENMRRP